jgi:hypothetical protein
MMVRNPKELKHLAHGVLRTVGHPSIKTRKTRVPRKSKARDNSLIGRTWQLQRFRKQKYDYLHGEENNNEHGLVSLSGIRRDMPEDLMFPRQTVA